MGSSDIIFNDSGKQTNLKRNLSFTQKERKSSPKLKRSSTAKESYENKEQSFKNHEKKNRTDMSLYDNLGYDRSPDVGQKLKSFDKRQKALQNLKEQINCQLKKTSTNNPGTSISLTSTAKRKNNNQKDNPYMPMNEELDNDINISDSDCSSNPLHRKSPPTQVQSLSEESSGCSTRRKNKHLSETSELNSSDSDNVLSPPGPVLPGAYDF